MPSLLSTVQPAYQLNSTQLFNIPHELSINQSLTSYEGMDQMPFFNGDYAGADDWVTDDILDEIHKTFMTYDQLPIIVLIVLYSITFVLGLIGNLLVIIVFARNRKMRTVTHSFLVNLAICDLMVVCMCMPFSVAFEIYTNWIYGNAMCKIVNFSQGLSVSSSIMTLAVISAERFYAIRRPLRARAFMSRTRIQMIICSIWIISAFIVLPTIFVREEDILTTIFTVTIRTCLEKWNSLVVKHVYNFALLFILYMAPVIFICVGYLQIGLNLWRVDSSLHACASAAETENARANLTGRRRVAKMLFIMAVLFALSWLPVHVMGILLDFVGEATMKDKGRLLRLVHTYALWIAHSNSSINPICYCIMSSSFKSALRLEFQKCLCHRVVDIHRDSFASLSMSMTVTTSNGAHGPHRSYSTRVVYHPIAPMNGKVRFGSTTSKTSRSSRTSRSLSSPETVAQL